MRKKRRKQFNHRNDEAPYIAHIMIDNLGQQVLKPLYHTAHRGMSLPPPVPLDHHVAAHRDEDEEDKENSAALPYYPTCHWHQYYSNVPYNPFGYYYAPANVLFHPRSSDDSDQQMNKRNRKHRRKSISTFSRAYSNPSFKKDHGKCYKSNRIVPTMKDNRTLLHVYPMIDMHYHNSGHATEHHDKSDPKLVKWLSYSGVKHNNDHRHSSDSKYSKMYKDAGNKKNKDRSMEPDARGRQLLDIQRGNRKNTLSGK
jgi:hypothetical protein